MKLKVIALSLFASLCVLTSSGQEVSKDIEKVKSLYEEGKYLRVEFKCYNLSTDDRVRREPLLYLYWSMSNYQISMMEDQVEDYPTAYKDAVKQAVKFMKKDKTKTFWSQGEDHIILLRGEVLAKANDLLAQEEYRKAKTEYKTLTKLSPADQHPWFMKSLCELELKMLSDARVSFEKAMGMEGSLERFAELSADQQQQLRSNFESWFEANSTDTDDDGKSRP